jgi:trans-aconitate methyltransferase
MDKKEQTIATYNASANALAGKFDNLGARLSDINETFVLIKKENPTVIEIGCGNGRDAAEIVKRTTNYLGIDISEKLIELARQKVPAAKFEVADIENYELPNNLDIIFAFASLIHVPKPSLQKILGQIFNALNQGGAVRLSMKYADNYIETTKEDEFGVSTYYLYSQEDIKEMAVGFAMLKSELSDLRGQKWLEILLQKRN